MDTAPDDILENIFKYIHRSFLFIAPVSKKWVKSYKKCKTENKCLTSTESVIHSENTIGYACNHGFDLDFFLCYNYDLILSNFDAINCKALMVSA